MIGEFGLLNIVTPRNYGVRFWTLQKYIEDTSVQLDISIQMKSTL